MDLRYRYQTYEFGLQDIHLRTLRDNQQFSDPEGIAEALGISSASWPLFGIVWPSGQVLAHFMSSFDVDSKRILEVGCGIGLTSLMLNQRDADITATDYHPNAGAFLATNALLNKGAVIPFIRTGWEDADSGMGDFDLIVGSDLLYEREHVALLASFIEQHALQKCQVVLVDPGRGHHARFSKRMVALGFEHQQHKPAETEYLDKPFKGQILQYQRG
ncbi:class I SAM-dependent methyltransferase [Oceanospirillum maris]|jgi:predicted nicotinamide N-methyase|uniref:class I SAM-dependent methyltransferase n=1 Tax=Oceanospirillum maris TaxID=64977 RepID=UPI000402B923|nr:methyltransferase domain-containing protein [Oceanospirillum maris]